MQANYGIIDHIPRDTIKVKIFLHDKDILRDILRDIENVKNDRYFATNFWLFICFRPSRTTMTWRTMCPSMLAGPMILWPSFSRKWVYLYLCWKHRALETGKIIILFCYIYTRSFSLALSFKFSSTISLFPTFFFFFRFELSHSVKVMYNTPAYTIYTMNRWW